MKTIEIYAIILVVFVLTLMVIGCILVNRKEKLDARKESMLNHRKLNNI